MKPPCRPLAAALLAASAVSLAAAAAAAPIAPTSSALRTATAQPVEPVQWWGFGPYDYYAPGYGWNPGGVPPAPAYTPGYQTGTPPPPGYVQGAAPPAPGYAAGYQAGAADAAACMQRFRSYDPVSRTYIGRDRQRHPCP